MSLFMNYSTPTKGDTPVENLMDGSWIPEGHLGYAYTGK